ncbi:TPA: aspartyl/glutamyl-tRNA amidotransferase subunit C [Candidatus Ventrenecus avicola]|nr:aspartyl/glutamyl-tRNA amidotransferase subunit C [Candidatus Ventrenecus stercoripullorum]HIR73985.1 aspartyl/glutamyl-tRNA amidotransferase subunit C [Candidatus Ventrenecus avicola]
MSKFTKEMIDDYADKLLIGLTEEEKDMIVSEFDIIDESIQAVTEIPNISSVEPMTHALDDFEFQLREDVAQESIPIDDLLRNSDDEDGAEIVVPKVVG